MHKPVMLSEVLSVTKEMKPRWILDATFGRGGHTRALLENFSEARVTALDQDAAAVDYARTNFAAPIATERLSVHHFNFHNF